MIDASIFASSARISPTASGTCPANGILSSSALADIASKRRAERRDEFEQVVARFLLLGRRPAAATDVFALLSLNEGPDV